ncbi:hypothetical protein QZH41_018357 [Actinostola sp. cb2023]|nr:hypothetical protein QZH41_018357 [Actinostola sp. cb2023]
MAEDSDLEVVENEVDIDYTQIFEGEDVKREVRLYLSTKNGKVEGAETTPFQLPPRWDYITLKTQLKRHVSSRLNNDDINIDNIYYKKNKGKTVVKIENDGDLPFVLKEYPFKYANGKQRPSSSIYLAVDWSLNKPMTPRRSPRNSKSHMDIFVFEAKEVKGKIQVFGAAKTLHKVSRDTTLDEIKVILRSYDDREIVFVPLKGLYWLKKGTKQCVTLKDDSDLEKAKEQYKASNLCLACATLSMASKDNGNIKRQLHYDGAWRDEELMKLESKKPRKEDNNLWNDCHAQLISDLEKKRHPVERGSHESAKHASTEPVFRKYSQYLYDVNDGYNYDNDKSVPKNTMSKSSFSCETTKNTIFGAPYKVSFKGNLCAF